MRNLDGTATTTDEGVLSFGTLPLNMLGGEGVSAIQANRNLGRVFWSGGNQAKSAAMIYARRNGMQTLEMTTSGRIMDFISPYLPRRISNPIWKYLSKRFARGVPVNGEAHFITTPAGYNPNGIWMTQERPILIYNWVNIITP